MSVGIFTIDDKIAAVDMEIKEIREEARQQPEGAPLRRHHEILKAICADLRARQDLPRNNALGDLGRQLERMKRLKPIGGQYDQGLLNELALTVVSKWPVISQALEQFGEETAE